jgi:hypothetical protein
MQEFLFDYKIIKNDARACFTLIMMPSAGTTEDLLVLRLACFSSSSFLVVAVANHIYYLISKPKLINVFKDVEPI